MAATADQPRRFPLRSAAGAAVVAGGALLGLAWWLVPAVFGDAPGNRLAIVVSAGAVLASSLVSLTLIALAAPRGLMPTVYAFFAGMVVRMTACMGAAMAVFYAGATPGRPLALALAVAYLPQLLLEVAFVAPYLWRLNPQPVTPSTPQALA